jgi:hypothetical protein
MPGQQEDDISCLGLFVAFGDGSVIALKVDGAMAVMGR